MAGIKMPPRAATVAGPEPEMAAKKQEVMMVTKASPLRRWPTSLSQRLISFSEMPAFSIMFPAKTKKGMAKSRNLVILA